MSGYSDDDFDRDDRSSDREDRADRAIRTAKSMVTAPAIGLIVVAAFGLLSVVLNLVQYSTLDKQFDAEVKKVEDNGRIPADQKKEQIELMNKIRGWMKVGFLPYLGVIGLVAVITFVGGLKLMSLSSPGWVYSAAILSFLPCSGCCVLGLVFGIWAIVAMGKPEVKAGFAARRRASSAPDAY